MKPEENFLKGFKPEEIERIIIIIIIVKPPPLPSQRKKEWIIIYIAFQDIFCKIVY